jgi:hypothetical protein
MSSTGPGSLLVFLAFLMLSMLLAGTYFVAYLGLVQAGREVQKAGEAASEQAIIYLFQHPTNITVANGSPIVKGETRIVIQNVGPRDISFDRILAISPDGSVVADVKVPGNKGLGVRQWQLYKVQDLGLPDRWSNFTVFSSEVSRLVLLSERGRTHGSIWGVPPFLEGVLKATVATTMTTSYFYSYITTTSYRTTYTVTVPLKQSRYSLMGEWWESDDGKNWYKVTSSWGRKKAVEDCTSWYDPCNGIPCYDRSCSRMTDGAMPLDPERPVITYHSYNETLTLKPPRRYTLEGWSQDCYFDSNIGECVIRYTEWGRTYKLQAIELVDWDTGEVYASVNQTSLTFNIVRNTIARYKYVLTSSWSREWIVILLPPPPEPERCQQILNDPNARCGNQWCYCLYYFDRGAWEKEECCQPKSYSCLSVSVDFCCSGDEQYSCLASRNGEGGRNCVEFTAAEKIQGVTKPLPPVSWRASWRLVGPWVYDRIVQVGNYNPPYCTASVSGNSASGKCCIALSDGDCKAGNVGPNQNYSTTIVIVFKKT